ncbi:hypothetical protein AAFF_G00000130 [Aldrovandia affinis]|uniref:Uncharacterized protein n=1 Tax=Aldrovandia affinis TaxID=143900 RepID=A0AAD7X4D0_9TELE|nr:hypothetical protein AAFF_G00000130 [Aldrovandia affinis]
MGAAPSLSPCQAFAARQADMQISVVVETKINCAGEAGLGAEEGGGERGGENTAVNEESRPQTQPSVSPGVRGRRPALSTTYESSLQQASRPMGVALGMRLQEAYWEEVDLDPRPVDPTGEKSSSGRRSGTSEPRVCYV